MAERPIDFSGCERGQCRHELARAVAVAELISRDGPFPTLPFLGRPPVAPIHREERAA